MKPVSIIRSGLSSCQSYTGRSYGAIYLLNFIALQTDRPQRGYIIFYIPLDFSNN
ncbi:hypothetical protein KsCSTR_21930 [Candidatus Kuenenia stuttgartiensis]|uniref:Uncharacterized protein n=1 Tax=Kuenenia stuttgartiensis TaxID=174633 RepID=Q1Q376_KUEST|nr:hypothetical protein KsCSTR_21930 [Candidatus Kuenenia stuttgartiensis]CAJ74471.1 unknown protein [Candidatus Kuenenia stuttgartiensis]